MARKPPRLGKVQLQIMQILWQRGRATAREITLDFCRTSPIAHSTVQTLLRQLEEKGAVTHDTEERTFVYRPLYQQEEIAESALDDLLSRLFQGSAYGLMAHLLKRGAVSPDEMNRLRALIDKESRP